MADPQINAPITLAENIITAPIYFGSRFPTTLSLAADPQGSVGSTLAMTGTLTTDGSTPIVNEDLAYDSEFAGKPSFTSTNFSCYWDAGDSVWVLVNVASFWKSTAPVASPDLIPAGGYNASTNPLAWRPLGPNTGTPAFTWDVTKGTLGQFAIVSETTPWQCVDIAPFVWTEGGGSGGGVTWSDTAPVDPGIGDGWGDSETGILSFWDGTVWVATTAPQTSEDIAAFLGAEDDAAARTELGVVTSATAPTTPTEGMIWRNSTNGQTYTYQGGAWSGGASSQVTKIAFLGDSITETASEWSYSCFIGTGNNAVIHQARQSLTDIELITVEHVNGGINQSLSVVVTGNSVAVNLATNGSGVVTSTVDQVKAACNASAAYVALGLFCSFYATGNTAQAGTAKYLSPTTATSADGYAAWMQLLSRGRFEPVRFSPTTYPGLLAGSYTFGKSGLTTASLITYVLPDVLLLAPGTLLIEMSGANDILQSVAEGTTVANRVAMWTAMLAAGVDVVACEVLPMIESAPLVATGDNADIVSLNAALKAEAATLGIQWIEWPASLFDGSEAEATLWEVDGIHPNPAGCRIMGQHVLDQLGTRIAETEFQFPDATSPQWISANPYMTGGTTIATGWTTPSTYATSVTPSKISGGAYDGWQRLTVDQALGQYKLTVFNQSPTTVTPGQVIRVAADMRISSGFKNVRAKVTFTGALGMISAFDAIDTGTEMNSSDFAIALDAHNGVWLSHPEVVPTGATAATLTIWSFGEGTIDIGKAGIIDVDVAAPSITWPTSPSDGDSYSRNGRTWVYNGSSTAWEEKVTSTKVAMVVHAGYVTLTVDGVSANLTTE